MDAQDGTTFCIFMTNESPWGRRPLSTSFSSKVLWDDLDGLDTLPSTRQFINMFFVDQEESVADAVVAVRLPYDRVKITGTDPFTFLSNDVVRVARCRTAFLATRLRRKAYVSMPKIG